MKSWLANVVNFFESLLNHPVKVIWLCLIFAFINLIADGTLLQLWSLNRNIDRLNGETVEVRQKLVQVRQAIEKASDPDFIEHQARERFDLVNKGDLVFVFSED